MELLGCLVLRMASNVVRARTGRFNVISDFICIPSGQYSAAAH